MGLLSGLFGGRGARNQIIKTAVAKAYSNGVVRGRSYEAAKSTRLNSKHWARATNQDINSALLPVLQTLRNRCWYELKNNGFAAGMVRTHATDIVGRNGPTIEVESDSDEFTRIVEEHLAEWLAMPDASGKQAFADMLKTGISKIWPCGEFYWQLVNKPEVTTRVKTRLLGIAPARVASPWGAAVDGTNDYGIKVDADGAAIEYYILKKHPGALTLLGSGLDVDTVPAQAIVHFFEVIEDGQKRGQPWMASTLENFAHLRDFRADTLLAAHMASMLAVILYKENSDRGGYDQADSDLDVVDIEPGTMMEVPEGRKPQQIKPEHPSTTFKEFNKEILGEVGRPVGMPYMRLACDASGHNYSSARMDNQGYWQEVESIQGWLERIITRRIIKQIIGEIVLADPSMRQQPYHLTYVWNRAKHVDPLKEALAQKVRLLSGTTSLIDECEAENSSYEDVVAKQKRAKKMREDAGLPPIPGEGTESQAKGARDEAEMDLLLSIERSLEETKESSDDDKK